MSGRTREIWNKQCEGALQEALSLGKGYVKIPLTQEQVTTIDLEDYELVRDTGPWYARWYPGINGFYAVHNARDPEGRRITEYLHHLLLNPPDDMQVDHINHATLDNRRQNLRPATQSQNMGNYRPQKGTSSQYKGVCWHKQYSKWVARIMVDGTKQHLGYFDSELEAAAAYNRAARETFGEFAKLNRID